MTKLEQIINERLENTRDEFLKSFNDITLGKCKAYQDCLNLLPAPRTEADILNDFEVIKYTIYKNDEHSLMMSRGNKVIHIIKPAKLYRKYDKKSLSSLVFDMQEHKLLNELFNLWRWL
jgi:hypothetical protein